MSLTRIGPPAVALLTLAEVKQHLRVDGNDEDPYIGGLIEDVTAHLDGPRGVLGRSVRPQKWRWDVDWCGWHLRLPLPDASDVEAIVADGDSDVPVKFDLRDCGPFLEIRFPRLNHGPVQILFRAQLPDDALGAVRRAMLLTIGHLYHNRESVVVGEAANIVPLSAMRFLAPLKVRWIG